MKNFKSILFVFSLLLMGSSLHAQKYMDEIAQKACDCLDNVPDSLNAEDFSMELGLCMIEVASPYQKQLKKDYGIDFKNIETEGEELGRVIGMKMVAVCPKALMRMAAKVNEENLAEVEIENEVIEEVYIGKITKVEEGQFVIFTVKNAAGKLSKFYWLTFIESKLELTSEYKDFTDKSVIITYDSEEFFDPRIGEYRMINIIKKMDVSGD